MKNIALLGSTGSIGTQTLAVVARFPERFNVIALAARRNIDLLQRQVERFRPELVVVSDPACARQLAGRVDAEVLAGEENIVQAAVHPRVDFVVNALVGKAGLVPTIEAIRLGRDIGLANKETLVLAGAMVMELAAAHGAAVIPIDSEHCALFQSLKSGAPGEIRRLILTMGKGPIAAMDRERLERVTMQDVLDRPSWDMGMKINVDSATCVNKAFEVIEAHWLFGVPPERISIVVHPQYICHSLVEFRDGSIITELGTADMRRYTQYALFYPERGISPPEAFVDLLAQPLVFEAPPFKKFPCLSMGHQVIEAGGTLPAVFHGADTAAVRGFMEGKITFTQIPAVIQAAMDAHETGANPDLAEILAAERWAESFARRWIEEHAK